MATPTLDQVYHAGQSIDTDKGPVRIIDEGGLQLEEPAHIGLGVESPEASIEIRRDSKKLSTRLRLALPPEAQDDTTIGVTVMDLPPTGAVVDARVIEGHAVPAIAFRNHSTGPGIEGESVGGDGVVSTAFTGGDGVVGIAEYSGDSAFAGVRGIGSTGSIGGHFLSTHDETPGLIGRSIHGEDGYAAWFWGRVGVKGDFEAYNGDKSFRIDHPLDPKGKYLRHVCVESDERLNVYSGNVRTDRQGKAVVKLPAYFEALNREIRYQLTVIGEFAQAIVGSEVKGGRFTIRTDVPNVKVSWQVTGVRNDVWARKHPFVAERKKTGLARGRYLAPAEHGASLARGEDETRFAEIDRRTEQRLEKLRAGRDGLAKRKNRKARR